MSEQINPAYRKAVKANPLVDTPLFDAAAIDKRPAPPRVKVVSEARMNAFQNLRGPKFDYARTQVLNCLKGKQPASVRTLAKFLGREQHLVSGRITELRDMGYIEECGHEINPDTNRRNTLWRIKQ